MYDAPKIRTEIESLDQVDLKSRITDLGDSAARWRTRKWWITGMAAILGVLIGGLLLGLEVLENTDADLRDFAQEKLSLLQSQASDLAIAEAKRGSAEANALAQESEAIVASADAASREAVAKVADAEARIAEANRAASEANAIAEKERIARLELELRLAPRVLTDEQRGQIVTRLSQFGALSAQVVIWGDTYEIQAFARAIISCLRDAGWEVGLSAALAGAGNVTGIPIGVRSDADSNTHAAATELVSALSSVGVAVAPWDFDEMVLPSPSIVFPGGPADPAIKVFIGSKP